MGDLKLGLSIGYWGAQPPTHHLDLVLEAERLGFDSFWSAEAYGSDALTPLAWLGSQTSTIKMGTGIVQMSARTPASTAMSAVTMDHLSNGRFILGLGVSGPQVVEGWYGQPFPKPLARTREYVEIMRRIWAREEPVTFDGEHYPLPYPGGAGLGKALKITTHPRTPNIPIYLGAEGPKNVALAAEIADGWLPIFYSPERGPEMYAESLANAPDDFEIACPVTVVLNNDVGEALTMIKWTLALYIGGMGAKKANFHLDVVGRMGFSEAAEEVQSHYLAGNKEAAMKAVPDDLADQIALVGPAGRIAERLQRWVDSPVTTILAGTRDPEALRVLAEALS